MRYFIFLITFFGAQTAFAQDTSLITKAIHFVNTDEFKKELEAFAKNRIEENIRQFPAIKKRAVKCRKEQMANARFWTNAKCFSAGSSYYTPVLASRAVYTHDTLIFQRFDTAFYKVDHSCDLKVEPFLLSNNIVELRHFEGRKSGNIRFGETHSVRFAIVGDKLKLIQYSGIYHN
jgi:hypothetical protein